MDLGAFLPPGGFFSIAVEAGPGGARGDIRGRALERRGRPFWLVADEVLCGRVLKITVEMPGYSLAGDGSLRAAGPGARAYVVLLGQVKNCRFIRPWKQYALRLKLLGRIWP